MKPIPDSVHSHIQNARYWLDAARKFPPPTKNAAHILLLLAGWENIVIAEHELNAWASDENVDPKIYRDHATKLKTAPEVLRVILGPSGKPTEIRYSTGKDFAKLRESCQYGSNAETEDISKTFASGWHADGLERGLIERIRWVEVLAEAYGEVAKSHHEASQSQTQELF